MYSSSAAHRYQTNGVRIGYIPLSNPVYTCVRKYIVCPTTLAEVNQHCPNPGLIFDITTLVFKILKIPLEKSFILPMPNRDFGTVLNGTWHGKLGNLSRGEIDCTLPYMTPTRERLEVVDFSAPIETVELGFLTRLVYQGT